MGTTDPAAGLGPNLHDLASRLDRVRFGLPTPTQAEDRAVRAWVLWSIREYLLPRLADWEAPLLAVVVGSTGSGKSTIVNSLAQQTVSAVGVIRPTTTAPVVWCHVDNADRYRERFVGSYGASDERPLVVAATDDPLLRHLTVVDAPDFDSVVGRHRDMAEELLAAADVAVFVASAQRYADAVPWEFLEQLKSRDLATVLVLNRVTPRSEAVLDDYTRLLTSAGLLGSEPIVVIDEQTVDPAIAGLPPPAVAPIRARLEAVAERSGRDAALAQAIAGTTAQVGAGALDVADRVERQRAVGARLIEAAAGPYRVEVDRLGVSLAEGTLIRGEVLARWEEFVGTGELTRALASGASRFREWARRVFGGQPVAAQLGAEAGSELVSTVTRRADAAARSAAAGWESDSTGRILLAAVPEGALWRHDPRTEDEARNAVADWMGDVVKLVREEGQGRKKQAQAASYGVNAAAVVLLLAVFVHTAGLTGAELGIAAGAAAAQQKILEHVFGKAAARALVEEARRRLAWAVGVVIETDGQRFAKLVTDLTDGAETAPQIRQAVAGVAG